MQQTKTIIMATLAACAAAFGVRGMYIVYQQWQTNVEANAGNWKGATASP